MRAANSPPRPHRWRPFSLPPPSSAREDRNLVLAYNPSLMTSWCATCTGGPQHGQCTASEGQGVRYCWPRTLRRPPDTQIAYLDLNHWITLAKAYSGHRDGRRQRDILDRLLQSVQAGEAVYPISFAIYVEIMKIRDRRHRAARRLGVRVQRTRPDPTTVPPIMKSSSASIDRSSRNTPPNDVSAESTAAVVSKQCMTPA